AWMYLRTTIPTRSAVTGKPPGNHGSRTGRTSTNGVPPARVKTARTGKPPAGTGRGPDPDRRGALTRGCGTARRGARCYTPGHDDRIADQRQHQASA